MILRTIRRCCALVGFLLVGASPLMAQGVGSIGGTVADTSGAVLPGATVTITLEGGGIGSGQTAVTNDQGVYQFTRLVPGTYSVRPTCRGSAPSISATSQ